MKLGIIFLVALFGNQSFAADVHICGELHRVEIENKQRGLIKGSYDQGKTWIALGKILVPFKGGVWKPTEEAGVLAFDFLRGASSVFASAVNAIHIRFSDPVDYELPKDPTVKPIAARAISLYPRELLSTVSNVPNRIAVTSIKGGTSLFGREFSPKVQSTVLVGDGQSFRPISYFERIQTSDPDDSHLLILTPKICEPIEYFEFENVTNGRVIMKRQNEAPIQFAKVILPVEGVGRFIGSEYIVRPGVIRANHAGVLDIGTTDINVRRSKDDINELRGGFQIVPSHHWFDRSMSNSRINHPEVYLVVGPIKDPVDLVRYDRGIDGTYPLFNSGLRAGATKTYIKTKSHPNWTEIDQAVRQGFLKTANGHPINHLRGFIRYALRDVTAIRVQADPVE